MKSIVLGGGVIGVTTAYYLAQEGHEVVVVEARDQLGTDATGGNAGLIAPGHSFAWASPAAPRMLLASLRGQATAIRVKPRLDPKLASWGLQFLRECTTTRAEANTLIKLKLCKYSQGQLNQLAAAERIEFEHVQRGAAYLYRTEADLELGVKKMDLLRCHGVPMNVLDAKQVAELDPAFASAGDTFAGGIHVTSDASGDSELFTNELADRCKGLGVQFELGVTAERFVTDGDSVRGVQTSKGLMRADNYVLALGIQSPFLSKTAGQRLPIYPAKGYSLTADIIDPEAAPKVGGVDEATLVAWSRFGDQLRMSSTAEFSGYSRDWKFSDFSNVLKTGREIFPRAVDWDGARMRACLRPMTPDGPPIIGRGKHTNLFYNTGHGHMGWTMACGSSRILTDVMAGRKPALDLRGFEVRSRRVAA
ncbi:D-amino acid dehydrogenase [Micromonospora sp. NBC_00389]|uniref:D-amino acid dehydrogenase n=1 Tax=Micromonospora sp. NBC_00389 TaxID=2903586 RepID=UPI002E20D7B5